MNSFIKKILVIFVIISITFVITVISILWTYSNKLPDYKYLKSYKPSVSSKMYSGKGVLVSDFSSEKRIFVPFSAIPIKVINSFAFNLIALKTGFNNAQIKKNKSSVYSIKKIMREFEKIIVYLGIPIYQSIASRINQTLSSTRHTLSMLADFKKKKPIEIKFAWKNLYFLSKLTNIKTNFTLKTYQSVYKKIYNEKRKK